MKKRIVLLLGGILIASTLLWSTKGYCFNCRPRRCWNDIECGLSCWCYKGTDDVDLYGVCVSD